ncbi:MAG TPA: hypothetical protein PLV87_12620, partial [Opitutaceae bacterium]|nr:hypothetical protein [Opitutaceae bacterium]
MKRHRITFMLAEANPLEKRILAWIEGLRADRGVPLKVHLVPVLARGLGLTDEAMVGHAPARDKKPARRRSEPITHESGMA